jgi:hypothetical protein
MRSRLNEAAGHPSPLPPCLAGRVGRSRYADRLRPIFWNIDNTKRKTGHFARLLVPKSWVPKS